MNQAKNKTLDGIAASAGIAIGKSWILEETDVSVHPEKIVSGTEEEHLQKFRSAVQQVEEKFRELKNSTDDEEAAEILEAQIQTAKDPELYRNIERKVKDEKAGIVYAVFSIFNEYIELMESADAAWARERAVDIVSVRDQIVRTIQNQSQKKIAQKGAVVFAVEISSTVMIELSRLQISGIVMQKGGLTSHAIILCQSLGIPCVIGVPWQKRNVQRGVDIIIDGDAGYVILSPSEEQKKEYQKRKSDYKRKQKKAFESVKKPDRTVCGSSFTLRANVEFPEEFPRISLYGASGIGLLRTETMLFQKPGFDVEEQVCFYSNAAEASGSEPVTIRLFDAGGDKLTGNEESEANPFLGWRGIRMLLDKRSLLYAQLRAILIASGKYPGRIQLLIPMVSDLQEIKEVKKACSKTIEDLKKEGIKVDESVPIGIMIEVPATALMADILAMYVDFFSIGTNDLTQYTLAADRGNEKISEVFQPFHPSIWKLIQLTGEAAKKHGIPVTVCGELASKPIAAACLVGMGINDLSMTTTAIPGVKSLLCSYTLNQMKKLSEKVLNAHSSQDVSKLFKQFTR